MYCSHCNRKIDDASITCPFCGADGDFISDYDYDVNVSQDKKSLKDVKLYPTLARLSPKIAKVSIILGIVPIINNFLSIPVAIVAIIFSLLGRKVPGDEELYNCKKGLKYAIIGIVVTIVAIVASQIYYAIKR